MRRTVATKNLGSTLRPLSPTFKRAIRERYSGPTRLTPEARRELVGAIFEVENDLEHRQPKHPQVALMRAVRNVLLDDLGENEPQPGLRWPHIEAVEAVIREKRRKGNPESLGHVRPREAA